MARWTILKFIVMTWMFTNLRGQTMSDVKKLYKDLFSNYTKEILPMEDPNKPLEVGIIFYLMSLNHFKEVDEVISVLGVFEMNWTDPSLAWNPLNYGNLYHTVINPKDMWTPSLFLTNTVDKLEPVGQDITFQTTVLYTGNSLFYPGSLLNAKCPTDISKFPFDTQNCQLEMVFWGIPNTHMSFQPLFDKVVLDWYKPHSDWSLTEHSIRVIETYEENIFCVQLTIKRQPLYHTVVIILPTILFAFLNPLVFVLPVESGERVSLAMTILLSYAIFLTLVSASIPASSSPMCFLLVVMIAIIFVSGLITCGSIVSAKYYHLDDTNSTVSPLIWFTRWRLRRPVNTSVFPVEDNNHKEIVCTGKEVSASVDTLLFYGSYVIIIFIAITYFCYVLV